MRLISGNLPHNFSRFPTPFTKPLSLVVKRVISKHFHRCSKPNSVSQPGEIKSSAELSAGAISKSWMRVVHLNGTEKSDWSELQFEGTLAFVAFRPSKELSDLPTVRRIQVLPSH